MENEFVAVIEDTQIKARVTNDRQAVSLYVAQEVESTITKIPNADALRLADWIYAHCREKAEKERPDWWGVAELRERVQALEELRDNTSHISEEVWLAWLKVLDELGQRVKALEAWRKG